MLSIFLPFSISMKCTKLYDKRFSIYEFCRINIFGQPVCVRYKNNLLKKFLNHFLFFFTL